MVRHRKLSVSEMEQNLLDFIQGSQYSTLGVVRTLYSDLPGFDSWVYQCVTWAKRITSPWYEFVCFGSTINSLPWKLNRKCK